MFEAMTIRILAFAGSLRKKSFNRGLVRAAVELASDGLQIDAATIDGIPLYDPDLEREEGIPEAVEALKKRVKSADGVLIATPEYNNGMPGVAKNAIDWLSRPPSELSEHFGAKPVGLIGATPGRGGTLSAQNTWLPVLRSLGATYFSQETLYVRGAGDLFDDDGNLTDESTRERLGRYLEAFAEAIARLRASAAG